MQASSVASIHRNNSVGYFRNYGTILDVGAFQFWDKSAQKLKNPPRGREYLACYTTFSRFHRALVDSTQDQDVIHTSITNCPSWKLTCSVSTISRGESYLRWALVGSTQGQDQLWTARTNPTSWKQTCSIFDNDR